MSNPKSMKPTGQTSKGGRKKVKQWHCDESVESTIRGAIIATPFALKAYDPGIFISYGSDENIHEVLGFHQLPAGLIQQVTANASATHFKTWIRDQFSAIAANCPVVEENGAMSTRAFHHLTFTEFGRILNFLNGNYDWMNFCVTSNPRKSAGTFVGVSNAGRRSNEMVQIVIGPFLG